jgi:hypothetical protein
MYLVFLLLFELQGQDVSYGIFMFPISDTYVTVIYFEIYILLIEK